MLDHVSIGVSDIERSKAFYDQALGPLGIERLYAEDGLGYGIAGPAALGLMFGVPSFGITLGGILAGAAATGPRLACSVNVQ